jgi:hypothetical protein
MLESSASSFAFRVEEIEARLLAAFMVPEGGFLVCILALGFGFDLVGAFFFGLALSFSETSLSLEASSLSS